MLRVTLLGPFLVLCLLAEGTLSRELKENEDKSRAKVSMTNGLERWKGKLIIKSDPNNVLSSNALNSLGLKKKKSVGSKGWMLVNVADKENATAKMNKLKNLGYTVEYDWVVRKLQTPSDPSWSEVATAMEKISAPLAWDTTTGSSDVSVCVIDTGIDMSHPDLKDNYVTSYNAITNEESDTAAFDDDAHGTHCSGTIGAVANNGEGVAGVAWSVKLYACKFLGADGTGEISDAIECVKWCREKGAKITSNSWGGGGFTQALQDEIELSQEAGHLFIAAAGNDGNDIDQSPTYPASYPVSNVISVGNSDSDDNRWTTSNYGANEVDFFAPGRNIYSTVPGGYGLMTGTSMACPHVSGAAALIWSLRPDLSADQVKSALMDSVDAVDALQGLCVTGGRLNVAKALELASAM